MKTKCVRFIVVLIPFIILLSCTPLAEDEFTFIPAVSVSAVLNSPENAVPNGEFDISLLSQGGWVTVGTFPAGKHLQEKHIDVAPYAEGGGPVTVRIRQNGGGAAHLDSVLLNGSPPAHVEGMEDGLRKLKESDFDVADVPETGVTVSFGAPAGSATGEELLLSLRGRIEAEHLPDNPFLLPAANYESREDGTMEFYTYRLGSQTAGGSGAPGTSSAVPRRPDSSSEAPFLQEWLIPGSGHPEGYVYIWVENDDENLYITIDLTPDNTLDSGQDYAKVITPDGEAVKVFTLTSVDDTWGTTDFIYTDKVAYQHKVCSFILPLEEFERDGEGNVKLAFSLYGTMIPTDAKSAPDLAFDSNNYQYLLVYELFDGAHSHIKGLLLNPDGSVKPPQEIDIENGSYEAGAPAAVYDPVNQRFLVVWEKDIDGSPSFRIAGQLINADGTLFGGEISIGEEIGSYQRDPAVAFDTVNSRYLVVWQDDRSGSNIYGQLITAGGSKSGSNFDVSIAADSQTVPAAAFNSSAGNYLVAWCDGAFYSVKGRTVSAAGVPQGDSDLVLSESYLFVSNPDLAYNEAANQYLLAFSKENTNIRVRLLSGTGEKQGSSDAEINISTNNQSRPSVVYDAKAGSYFTVWVENIDDSDFNIYARRVSSAGDPTGSVLDVNTDTDSQMEPAAAICGISGGILVGFKDYSVSPYDILLKPMGNTSRFIVVDPGSYDFGTVNQGEISSVVGFTVYNAGVQDLSVTDITISGTSLADFAFPGAAPSAQILGSGENLSASVVFAPQSGGAKSVTLSVASNDTENADKSVAISGEARSIPALVYPEDEQADLPAELTFIWKTPYEPEGETAAENFYISEDADFTGATPVEVARSGRPEFLLAGFGLFSSAGLAVLLAGRKGGRKAFLRSIGLLAAALLLLFLWACRAPETPEVGGDESSYTVTGLTAGTTYYWKVEAVYSSGNSLTSDVRSFTTK